MLKQAEKANADSESIAIIKKYSKKILESMRAYYNADLSKSCTIIRNLILDLGDDPFAVNALSSSDAFFGSKDEELQFFRCRTGNLPTNFKAEDMLYLPENMRSKSGNYRFSIPGNPSLYLANSSYGCWIETGLINNIGNYDRQYPYRETEFYEFDKFLFAEWSDKGKDRIPWGIDIE